MTSSATTNPATTPTSKAAPTSGTARLIADIEEVLASAGNVADLDVAKLRDSLRQKIAMAKSGLAAGGRRITETAGKAAGATDDYVHGSPWTAIGVAAFAGVAIGYLLARR